MQEDNLKKALIEEIKIVQHRLDQLIETRDKLYPELRPMVEPDKISVINPNASTKKNKPAIELVYEAIKENGKFLHSRQIVEHILKTTGQHPKNVSQYLSQLKAKGKVVKHSHDSQNLNTFWGLAEYVDVAGNIKQGREYDKNYISYQK